ncbi:MAG TPA: hypothetical protein VIX18_04590 [Nitrospirota bacterium]
MGQGARVKKRRMAGLANGLCLPVMLCILFIWSPAAGAGTGRGMPNLSAEPKRAYGSIDVILYRTSW